MKHVKIAFIDLDGVLNAVSSKRAHLVPEHTDRSSYWAEWHKAHLKEAINPAAVYLLSALVDSGHYPVFCSSRQDTCTASTFAQINGALRGVISRPVQYSMSLRTPKDDTPPPEYKAHVVTAHLIGVHIAGADKISVICVDDDQSVLNGIKEGVDRLAIKNLDATYLKLTKFTGE